MLWSFVFLFFFQKSKTRQEEKGEHKKIQTIYLGTFFRAKINTYFEHFGAQFFASRSKANFTIKES